ncbi:MAG TPA: glycerol-3-phosphate acyltransferase, partial [Gemmatimonadaceae bacterium]
MTLPFVAAVAAAYLLGSIPAAYIAGSARGIDLRKHGSGNLGATNVMRVLGTKIGLLVFAFDMAKGAAPVLLFPRVIPVTAMPMGDRTIMAILCGIAAIIGHVRPIYLKFGRGGKGVATAAGVFLALAPVQTLLTLIIFAVVLLSSGYVSLGSL